ncbi:MAG: universal stress protein, partial [Gemmatimonadota bacterium]
YDLVVMGAHGIGKQPFSQLGSVTMRSIRGIEKDVMIVRDERPLEGGEFMVCVDGSAYSYKGMRKALEMAREYDAKLYVCSSFDVEYHHAVFGNIRYVLSEQASKVFKFEEQEELHNNIIDKGLLKLAKANIKRAQAMAEEFPDVEIETQILIGKPFQAILQWVEEVDPSLLILARHGAHRIEDTEMGSQADNLTRLAPTNVLLIGTTDVRPEEIPWIEEDGEQGLEWAPEAEVRIMRVPPFALGIARKAVEEYVLEHYGPGSVYATGVGGEGGHSEIPEGFSVRGARRGSENPDADAGAGRGGGIGGTATRAAGNGNGASASVNDDGGPADRTATNADDATNGASADAQAGNGAGRGNGAPAANGADPNAPAPEPEPGMSQAPHADHAATQTGEDYVDLPIVTNERLDEAIQKLLPTHMQLVMGIGTAEELATAEVKAEEAMKRTVVEGHDADPVPETPMVETKCPYTGHVQTRERTAKDPIVWTHEAYERLKLVPLIARPLARNTVEKFAREHGVWRVTTRVMDENKQAMIEADTFDLDTMLVMFKELQSKQLKAEAEGVDALTPEMRRFIDEAKEAGVTRCPIRDIEKAADKCPVDLKTASPEEAKAAVEAFMASPESGGGEGAGD